MCYLFARRALPPIRDQRHPASHAPRIFADSADIRDIEPLYRAGIINGVTTNPTLVKKAGAQSWPARALATSPHTHRRRTACRAC